MNLETNTCEDCLSLLTGVTIPTPGQLMPLRSYQKKSIETTYIMLSSDVTILNSIARQLQKSIALTDRQYELVKEKLISYKDQFAKNNINVVEACENLKFPLREIDRSHWVKMLEYNGEPVIGIRFPFNKKIIDLLEAVKRIPISKSSTSSSYKVKDHTHIFDPTPSNIYEVIKIAHRFSTKFVIQKDLQQAFNQLQDYNDNKQDHIPGIYNGVLKNVPDNVITALDNDIGPVNNETLALYYDRRMLYGLRHFDTLPLEQSLFNYSELSNRIIRRERAGHIEDITRPFDQFVNSLIELKRFPLLMILKDEKNSDTAFNDLVTTYKSFSNIIDTQEISVLFRRGGDQDPFNDYIKDKKLNNLVDKHTKVVYISNNKLPKPLLKADWKHKTVMFYRRNGLGYNNTTKYAQECDCQIVCETHTTSGYFDRPSGKFIHANM